MSRSDARSATYPMGMWGDVKFLDTFFSEWVTTGIALLSIFTGAG